MPNAVSNADIRECLRLYGCSATSYLSLQDGMQYYYIKDTGYIAYKSIDKHVFVLGNPVCNPENYQELTAQFLKIHPKSCFIQVDSQFKDVLHDRFKYYGTAIGVETSLHVNWDLVGRKKQNIRTSINTVHKRDIVIRENKDEGNYSELMGSWLKTRKVNSREICFLVRPSEMDNPETRKFFAYRGDRLIGMMFFDPLYKDGSIFGYIPNICMSSTEFKQGIYYALAYEGFMSFKRERERRERR